MEKNVIFFILMFLLFACQSNKGSSTENKIANDQSYEEKKLVVYNVLSAIKNYDEVTTLILREANQDQIDSLQMIDSLPNLTTLDLSMSELKEFPEVITRFKSIRTLELNHNYLNRLPSSINKLTELEKLGLLYNKFDSIPESVCGNINLESINLNGNQVSDYPLCLGELRNLKTLLIVPDSDDRLIDSVSNLQLQNLIPESCLLRIL